MFGEEKKANKDQYTEELKNPQINSKEIKMSGIESCIYKPIPMTNVCMCLSVCVYTLYIQWLFKKLVSCIHTSLILQQHKRRKRQMNCKDPLGTWKVMAKQSSANTALPWYKVTQKYCGSVNQSCTSAPLTHWVGQNEIKGLRLAPYCLPSRLYATGGWVMVTLLPTRIQCWFTNKMSNFLFVHKTQLCLCKRQSFEKLCMKYTASTTPQCSWNFCW